MENYGLLESYSREKRLRPDAEAPLALEWILLGAARYRGGVFYGEMYECGSRPYCNGKVHALSPAEGVDLKYVMVPAPSWARASTRGELFFVAFDRLCGNI